MIILDVNILVYAWNADAPQHQEARKWVEQALSGDEWVGIPWSTVWAFARITTNQKLFAHPLDPRMAFQIVRAWIECPNVVIVQPGARHEELLRELVIDHQARGPLVTDAVLAAITIEQGARLASTDQDFSRFTRLKWFNPLVAG